MKNLDLKRILLLFVLLAICSCSGIKKRKYKIREARFTKTKYSQILGWNYDNHLVTLKTFANSCSAILKRKSNHSISNLTSLGGRSIHWQEICKDLQRKNFKTNKEAKGFFEKWFSPYKVWNSKNSPVGRFTGYYEIEINGSIKRDKKFKYPVYRPPQNLDIHQGKHYLSHSAINNGSLKRKGLELIWVDNHARLYFMHIQGSGRIKLKNNQLMRLGYAGQNGFSYQWIGTYLKNYNVNTNSLLDIMRWIHRNPRDGRKIMEKNQSYVFFKQINGDGPIGAQKIPLIAERSIALDSEIYPYGMPVWVETDLPKTKNYLQRKYRRLFITQDTGGAIKGAIRGDIFFGHGIRAEELACHMNDKGSMYVLFPKNVKIPSIYYSAS